MDDKVELINAGIAVDDRGQVQFCNDLDLRQFRRFYIVANHQPQFIRAWHGHKHEAKCVYVITGSVIVAAVKIDNWDKPAKTAQVHRFVLSDKKPAVLKIPAGYANGFKTLEPNTKIMFLSTSSLDESLKDDFRFESRYWDPWNIEER